MFPPLWREQSFGEKGDRPHFPEAPGREEAGGGWRGGMEKDRETLGGPAREEASSAAHRPSGRRAWCWQCRRVIPPCARQERFRSRARSDRPTLDLDHMSFSDSGFNSFETLAGRHWLGCEEGHRVVRGRGRSVSEAGSGAQGPGSQAGLSLFCCKRTE